MFKPKIIAKQFRLPLDETYLNRVFNNPDVVILDERVFQDKLGDVVVYLKYELYGEEEPTEESNEDVEF